MSRRGKAARLWLQACSVLLLGLALLAAVAWTQEVEFSDPNLRTGSSADESAEPAEPAEPGVVRVYFDDPAIARKIVISMEALESEYEKGYVVVLASEADLGSLTPRWPAGRCGRAMVRVTTLGPEFLREAEGECVVQDFPRLGETVRLEWQQNSQNFIITDVE